MDISELLDRAKQIRDETKDGANTAERVGSLLIDMIIYCQEEKGEYIVVYPNKIQATSSSASYSVEIKSNAKWSFSIIEGEDFISYEGSNQQEGNQTIKFTIAANITNVQRNISVKFITEGLVEDTLLIIQNYEGEIENNLDVYPTELNFGTSLSPQTLTITSSNPWEAYILEE